MITQWPALAAAVLASVGGWLIYTSGGDRRSTRGAPTNRPGVERPPRLGSRARQLSPAMLSSAATGAVGGWLLFGGVVSPVLAGLLATTLPLAGNQHRRRAATEKAAEAWPLVLEEIGLRTGSAGRSIPQALFEAGRRAPEDWRQIFAAAEREWLLTTDFSRTTALLKDLLADPTADVVCETLLLAHEVGGTEVAARLADLVEDRRIDLQSRKEAASRQAGVRFARRFVLLVPLGMAVAGLSIGTGRGAYETAGGQIAVAVSLVAVAACWVWSGRLLRLPSTPRVFP